eukprot:scaffold133755_cov18-Tisochrysis_lutea.AAC.1
MRVLRVFRGGIRRGDVWCVGSELVSTAKGVLLAVGDIKRCQPILSGKWPRRCAHVLSAVCSGLVWEVTRVCMCFVCASIRIDKSDASVHVQCICDLQGPGHLGRLPVHPGVIIAWNNGWNMSALVLSSTL